MSVELADHVRGQNPPQRNSYEHSILDSPGGKYSPTQPINNYYVPQKYSIPNAGRLTYEDFKK